MRAWSSQLTLGFASIAHSLSHLFVLLYATIVLVLEKDWGLSYAELLALSLPMSVMFGAAALPAGWLGDRWSAPGMMAVFFFGVGGSAILAGLANGPVSIAVALFLLGTFAAIYHPVGIPWLVKNARNHGRALGINGVFGSAGTAGAALVAGALSTWWGWRSAFIVPGVITIAIGLGFLLAMRAGAIHEAECDMKPAPAPTREEVKRVFFVMSATMLFTGLTYQVTSFALPKLFEERLGGSAGHSIAEIGMLVTVVYAASAFAQVIGGELADRFSMRRVYISVQWLQLPVVALAYWTVGLKLVPVVALLVALNTAGQPAENSLLARYTPAQWRGRAFGAKFVLTLGISSLGVGLIPTVYAMTGSLSVIFLLIGVFAVGAGASAWLLPRDDQATSAAGQPAPAE